jgi:protease YdgD
MHDMTASPAPAFALNGINPHSSDAIGHTMPCQRLQVRAGPGDKWTPMPNPMLKSFRFVVAIALVLGAGAAWAQKAPLQQGPKPPAPQTRVTLPMPAIGLLQIDGDEICTASVVAPRAVLTAAHCLFDEEDRPSRTIVFYAGYDRGQATVEARGIDRVVPRGYSRKRHDSSRAVDGLDWAIVRLDRDVGSATGVLAVRALAARELDAMVGGRGPLILQVGYGHGRGVFQSAIEDCRLLVDWHDNTFGHNCGTIVGDSGSPDMILENGRYVIVGIESADVDTAAMASVDMVVSAASFADAVAAELRSARPR